MEMGWELGNWSVGVEGRDERGAMGRTVRGRGVGIGVEFGRRGRKLLASRFLGLADGIGVGVEFGYDHYGYSFSPDENPVEQNGDWADYQKDLEM